MHILSSIGFLLILGALALPVAWFAPLPLSLVLAVGLFIWLVWTNFGPLSTIAYFGSFVLAGEAVMFAVLRNWPAILMWFVRHTV